MINSLFSHCAVMCYSTTICKLVDIIPALHEPDWQIPNYFSAKTTRTSYAVPPCNIIKICIHVVCVALRQLIMTKGLRFYLVMWCSRWSVALLSSICVTCYLIQSTRNIDNSHKHIWCPLAEQSHHSMPVLLVVCKILSQYMSRPERSRGCFTTLSELPEWIVVLLWIRG